MPEPRLRTVNKATAPFPTNKFPSKFIETFAKNIVYMMATKQTMSLEGNEWEQIFAECVGADWKPSNVGLDDVVLDNCVGSGTTAIAAIKEKRHFIGMELNKEYYDIACKRIKKEQIEIKSSLFNNEYE